MKNNFIILPKRYALRSFFIYLFLLAIWGKANAQTAASYSFSTTIGTYTEITGGAMLSSGATMDDEQFSVAIPSFTYLGTAYTQVFASENGYIQFGTIEPPVAYTYISSSASNSTLGVAAYNRDLQGRAGSELSTGLVGTEIVFQWKNLRNFLSTEQTYNFQIRLDTVSGVVSVVYGKMTSTTTTSAQVGLRGSSSDFNNRTSITSWTASASGTLNTATMLLSASVFPDSGYNYIWAPPPPCSAKPAPGTLSSEAGDSSICPFTAATLSVSGSTTATGIAYAWDSSTVSATGAWSTISGATASTYAASPAACSMVFYRRRTICVPTGLFDSSNAVSVSVKCTLVPPYFEDFESIVTANSLPNCVTATNVGFRVTTYLTADTYNRSNHTPGGAKYASFGWWGADDYVFTPGITITVGKTYQLSFWYITDGYTGWDSLKLQYGTSPSAVGMTTTLASLTDLTNTTYKKYTVRFVATTSGVQYFGFNCKSSFFPNYLSIDDIALQEVSLCSGTASPGAPTANANRVCGTGSIELDLPSLPAALSYVYQWQDSVSGGTWGTGLGRPSFGGTSIPFVTGVFSSTTYFRCIVTCAVSGLSATSSVISVLAGPYTPPYIENFESISATNQLPQCMTATNLASRVFSEINNSTLGRSNHTLGGSKYAYFMWSCDDYLFSPQMRLLAGQQYIFSFWYVTDGFTGWNTLSAQVGLDATPTAMTKTLRTLSNPINTVYEQYIDTFTVPVTENYYIGIYCNAGGVPWYLSIDDIGLQMSPCNGMPIAASISSSLPSGSGICANSFTQLKGAGGSLYTISGIKYQWQRRKLPLPFAPWQNIVGATDSLIAGDTLGGYDYRLAIVCTNTNDSAFSSIYSLPLLPAHPPISISPTTSPIVFCLGDTVKFNATDYPGSVYDWMKDSVVIPGWKFSDLGATTSGTYFVRASNSGTPCPAYSNKVVLIQNDPRYSVTISAPSDSIVCEGLSLLLTASGSKGGLTYQWYKNNSIILGATTNSYIVNTSGAYRVTAFDGISTCPASSRSINIIVNKKPIAKLTIVGGTTTACENEGVLLKANSGAFSYQWTKGGLTVYGWVGSEMRIKVSGTYSVKVRDANGCVSVTAPPVNINIIPAPIPFITRVDFKLITGTYASYRWIRNGSEFISSAPFITVSKKGLYRVIVTDANNCEGESLPIEMMDEVLNVNNVNLEQNVLVYPNPTNSKVFIESPVLLGVEVKDITGRTIIPLHNAKEIDLGKYADGIYLLYLSYEGQLLKQQKITKNTQ
ncbi:MAG: choice-of-anchor J domain-containing protein [Phycisphaerales bacterium]|nr:choice-of-anchor J domain-containing protein [Phycisphaerales bacterium]